MATATREAATSRGASALVTSADGTRIAFERVGRGAPVILVDGALCWRRLGPSWPLAERLAPHFTVVAYDRRGRGESGDTAPYAVEREVDDIAALVREVGGSACLWGTSSGAVLALEAARRLRGVRRVALYEAPVIVDDRGPTTQVDWAGIDAALGVGQRGAAVAAFLRGIGVPRLVVALMHLTPVWKKLAAVAHTLPYDGVLLRDYQRGQPLRAERWSTVSAPALVMTGGRSPAWMQQGNRALAAVLPDARHRTLHRQGHVVKPRAQVPALVEFFG